MIRTFNYTGRTRIDRKRITVELVGSDEDREFNASIDLGDLNLPGAADVYLEAYYHSSYMRFPFGKVNQLKPPPDRRLVDVDRGDVVFFRLKVVDPSSEHGRILGESSDIAPQGTDLRNAARISLLHVDYKDLGQEIWRLEFAPRPVLEVNSCIPGLGEGIREILRSDVKFRSVVFPAVLRQVLQRILIIERHDPWEQEEDEWSSQWLRFARKIHPVDPPGPDVDDHGVQEDQIQWIEDAVKAFCSHYGSAGLFGGAYSQ